MAFEEEGVLPSPFYHGDQKQKEVCNRSPARIVYKKLHRRLHVAVARVIIFRKKMSVTYLYFYSSLVALILLNVMCNFSFNFFYVGIKQVQMFSISSLLHF